MTRTNFNPLTGGHTEDVEGSFKVDILDSVKEGFWVVWEVSWFRQTFISKDREPEKVGVQQAVFLERF